MDETNWGGGILFAFKLPALQAKYMGRIAIKQKYESLFSISSSFACQPQLTSLTLGKK